MGASPSSWPAAARAVFLLTLVLLLSACRADLYSGLDEEQANRMLAVLLTRGVDAEKGADGRNGFTLSVDDRQIVLALRILKEHSLPRESFKSLGDVFSGDGMISTASEERARLAYAISQELADTFSRIDGVLTARVHVVPGVHDAVNNVKVEPTAAVFLRHTPDSPVVNLAPEIRRLTANAVASLKFFNVDVMLVPVRENVTLPSGSSAPEALSIFSLETLPPALLLQMLGASLLLALLGVGCWLGARRILARRAEGGDSGGGGASA